MPPNTPTPHQLTQATLTTGRFSYQGWSLLESILVLGAVSVLGLALWNVFGPGNVAAQVKTEQANLNTLSQNIYQSFGLVGNYQSVFNSRLIDDQLVPKNYLKSNPQQLRNIWGHPVTVSGHTIYAPFDGFQITYHTVPANACVGLANAVGRSVFDLKIKGVSVLNAQELDPDKVALQCNQADGAEMQFIYYSGVGPTLPTPPPSPCGSAPSLTACPLGWTDGRQWVSAPAPTCWTQTGACIEPPGTPCGPAPALPDCPAGWLNTQAWSPANDGGCWTLTGECKDINTPSCGPAPPTPSCPAGWTNTQEFVAAPHPACWTPTGSCSPPTAPTCGTMPAIPTCPSGQTGTLGWQAAPHPACWTQTGSCEPIPEPICPQGQSLTWVNVGFEERPGPSGGGGSLHGGPCPPKNQWPRGVVECHYSVGQNGGTHIFLHFSSGGYPFDPTPQPLCDSSAPSSKGLTWSSYVHSPGYLYCDQSGNMHDCNWIPDVTRRDDYECQCQ